MLVEEGGVAVEVPDPEDDDGSVFFNPEMELNRDVTVATLRTFERGRSGARTYLDAMAASGIRGVRAAADGWSVTLNDRGEAAAERCRHNLERNGLSGRVTERDANALLHESRFDVVDLDPFGSPIPFADAAFVGARRLVCVTATDTAPLCGAHFRSGIRRYGAVPRNTDYHAEMGLRVLLSALARTAARYDLGVTPLVSHATRHYVRTYLELERGATVADAAIDELGYLHHCEDCLHREAEQELLSHPWEGCPACGGNRVVTAGPVWLGRIRDEPFTRTTLAAVDDDMGRAGRARTLLERLADELEVPTHFDQHRLSKLWGRPAEAMDEFLGALRDAGFEASRTHYGGTTFKTDATVGEIASAIGA